jgi:hypothetical protein
MNDYPLLSHSICYYPWNRIYNSTLPLKEGIRYAPRQACPLNTQTLYLTEAWSTHRLSTHLSQYTGSLQRPDQPCLKYNGT